MAKKDKENQVKNSTLPHIGLMLKKHIGANHLYQSAWAKDQGVHAITVSSYLKKPTIQIDTMFDICKALKYNFFRNIADALPAELPPFAVNKLQTELDEVKKENEKLQMEVKILKEILMNKKSDA